MDFEKIAIKCWKYKKIIKRYNKYKKDELKILTDEDIKKLVSSFLNMTDKCHIYML